MRRSLESYGRKSLDADVEKDGAYEIDWDNDQDTYSALFTEKELAEIRAEEEMKKLKKMIIESEQPEYDAETLGEATKDVATQDKLEADKYDEKMAALLAKEVEELEGIF